MFFCFLNLPLTRVCAKTPFNIYIFGYLTEKKSISAILSDSILVFAQSDDRGYRHLSVCGSKTAGMHVSQPVPIERVLAVCSFVVKFVFNYKISTPSAYMSAFIINSLFYFPLKLYSCFFEFNG